MDNQFHEFQARLAGYSLVAGVDEAGRGPLAGPVVAAAVILPEDIVLDGVKDSKKCPRVLVRRPFPSSKEQQ